MDIRLIVLDLDGTTLTSEKKITPRTWAAIDAAIRAGITVVPATGRQLSFMPEGLLEHAGIPYIIVNNGAAVFSLPRKELILCRLFPDESARAIIAECRTYKALVFGCGPSRSVVDSKGAGWKDEGILKLYNQRKAIWQPRTADLEECYLSGKNTELCKFSVNFTDETEWIGAFERLKKRTDLHATSSDRNNIEVVMPSVCKESSVRFTAARLGVEMSQVMAVGDNLNDIEMIREAAFGVAMGNALPEVKAEADFVTTTCDEDGVALAIERMMEDRAGA